MTYGNRESWNTATRSGIPSDVCQSRRFVLQRIIRKLWDISKGIPQAFAACGQIPDRCIP